MSMGWRDMEDLFIRLGDELDRTTSLVVIGSAVGMSLGQDGRMTVDIDVWRQGSEFELVSLKRACAAVGVLWDPKGWDEPESAYLQMIDPGIVQLGTFDRTAPILTTGNLEIRRPPLENIIASKLVRGDARDFDDCVFLLNKGRVPFAAVRKVSGTIEDDCSRDAAMENLAVMEACLAFDGQAPSFF